jgi:uncharacterized protein YdeI (YjbR/CyaY-like superfamily)
MNPKVDLYIRKAGKWKAEMAELRRIILSCPFTEEMKWGKPCYVFNEANVIVMVPMKEHCALIVCKGALLKDSHRILIKPGENTQGARQLRFTSLREIAGKEPILKAYFQEAIEVEKAGLEVKYKKITEHKVPEEFQKKLDESPDLKTAFKALTPGRQRAYLIYFSAAKQSTTRDSRIEKCRKQILKGRGLNDR